MSLGLWFSFDMYLVNKPQRGDLLIDYQSK